MKLRNSVRGCACAVGLALVATAMSLTGAEAASASAWTATAACPAPRVTGLSFLLDAFSTGSAAGPSVFYGAALAALSQPLPEPFGTTQAQFLSEGAQGVAAMGAEGPKQIDALRTLIAPFAAGNEFGDKGVDAFADGLDAAATAGGKAIAPADLTLHQIATAARVAREEPAKPC